MADWDVELLSDPATDELSQAEEELLHQVFETQEPLDPGRRNPEIPEWKDPGTSSIPITYREILKAVKSDADVSADLDELKSMIAAQRIMQPA